MTPAELKIELEAFSWREELRQRAEWERTVWQTVELINIQLRPKDRIKDYRKLLPKTTEEKQKEQSVDEMAAVAVAWVKALGGVDKRKSAKGKG